MKKRHFLMILGVSLNVVGCNLGVSSINGGVASKAESTKISSLVESSVQQSPDYFAGFGLPTISRNSLPVSATFLPVKDFVNKVVYSASTNQDVETGAKSYDSIASVVLKGVPVFAFIDAAKNNALSLAQIEPGRSNLKASFPNDYTPSKIIASSSNLGQYGVSHVSMVEDSSNIYVAYKNSNNLLSVDKYGANNQTDKQSLRALGMNGNNITGGEIKDAAITSNSSTPIVVYVGGGANESGGAEGLHAMQYSGGTKNTWTTITGIESLIESAVSNSQLNRNSVSAISAVQDTSSNLYIAFDDDGTNDGTGTGSSSGDTLNVIECTLIPLGSGYSCSFIGGGQSSITSNQIGGEWSLTCKYPLLNGSNTILQAKCQTEGPTFTETKSLVGSGSVCNNSNGRLICTLPNGPGFGNSSISTPLLDANGAYETKLAVDDSGNLVLAYVDKRSGKLSVQEYNTTTQLWSYVGSLSSPHGQYTSQYTDIPNTFPSLTGFMTGQEIVEAKEISLVVAPSTVSNPTGNSASVMGSQILPYLSLNSSWTNSLSNLGVTFANQAILISFNDVSGTSRSAETLVYDGNSWEYASAKDVSDGNEVHATSIAIDKKSGYYYVSYIDESGNFRAKFAPQSPFNKILFVTKSTYSGQSQSLQSGGWQDLCERDSNNPFSQGNGYSGTVNSGLGVGTELSPLIRDVGNYLPSIGSPTIIGNNYYSSDYRFLFTEKNQYLGGAVDGTSPANGNPIVLSASPVYVWTGVGGWNCYNWSSNSGQGYFGAANHTDSTWFGAGLAYCSQSLSYYCATK